MQVLLIKAAFAKVRQDLTEADAKHKLAVREFNQRLRCTVDPEKERRDIKVLSPYMTIFPENALRAYEDEVHKVIEPLGARPVASEQRLFQIRRLLAGSRCGDA